jgi:uncharacterized protein
MMPVWITAFYAAILALFIVACGVNVTAQRFKHHVMLGDGGNPELRRMIRIHGNSVENVPLCILLMGLYELDGGSPVILHIAGITLIIGRLLYTVILLKKEEPSAIRATGVTVTWLTTIGLAVLNLWLIR